MDSFGGGFTMLLRLDGEVNHHDRVLLHDANEHDESDEAVDVQVETEQHERQQRAKACRWQAGQNRDGMDEALIQNSKNDVDDDDGHDEQN